MDINSVHYFKSTFAAFFISLLFIMTTEEKLYLLSRQVCAAKEVFTLAAPLTGPVKGCFKVGINTTNGTYYYKDVSGNWAAASGGGTTYTGLLPIVVGGSVISVTDASATTKGVVNTVAQTFIGQKTFIDTVVTNNSFKSIDTVAGLNATAEFTADLPAAAYPIGILKIGGSNGYIASARFMVTADVSAGVSRSSSLLIATNPNDNDSAQQNLYLTIDPIAGIARIATYMRGGQIPGGYPIVFAPQGNEKLRLPITGNVAITTPLQEVVLEYVDNAAALAASLPIGTHYRTGDLLKIVH